MIRIRSAPLARSGVIERSLRLERVYNSPVIDDAIGSCSLQFLQNIDNPWTGRSESGFVYISCAALLGMHVRV
jgi:hypothetical protein